MTTRRHAGFTLVELMLVVALFGIVAAISIPGLARARASAMEMSTIETLRAIHTAHVSFQSVCGGGFYAPSMSWLTRAPRGGVPFLGSEFSANTITRQDYRIRFSAGPRANTSPRSCNGLRAGRGVNGFFVGADLLVARGGLVSRYFGINHAGVVYQSTRRIAPFYAGAPRPPARAIQ